MPTGYWTFSAECRAWVEAQFPAKQRVRILDVGAGAGKWRDILFDYPNMDAIEVWPRWIERYNLRDRYKRVFECDVRSYSFEAQAYDLVVLGDVLEHMSPEDASAIMDRIHASGAHAIVALPYMLPQDEFEGNPYERHVQDDLTHELVLKRFSRLDLLIRNGAYGIYIQGGKRVASSARRGSDALTVDVRELVNGVRLAIATPTPGSVTIQYMRSVWRSQQAAHEAGLSLSLLLVQSTADVSRARNMLVAQFMSDPSLTHLLFADSDQGFEPRDWLRLLAFDREVVGVAARKKTPSLAWAVNFMEGASVIERGVLEVNEIGTGFLMIRRDAIERMMKEFPHLKIEPESPSAMVPEAASNYFALFDTEIVDGYMRSEDLTFCKRWRSIGGRVWADPKGDIVHVGSYEYRGSIEPMLLETDGTERVGA